MPKARKHQNARRQAVNLALPQTSPSVQVAPQAPVCHDNDIVTIDVPTAITINQRTYVGKSLRVPKAVASEIQTAVQKWEQHKRENMEGRPIVKIQGKDRFHVFHESEHWASDITE